MVCDGSTAAGATAQTGERPDVRPPARRGSRPGLALWCVGAAILLLVTALLLSSVLYDVPPSVVPPAGEVLQGSAPFRFAIVSDSRGNQAVFEEALSRIKQDDIRLVLHAGDIANGYRRRDFDWVLHELAEEDLRVPFCPVPGNHDIDRNAPDHDDGYKLYGAAFGQRRYWFSYANALFVAFDDATGRCLPDDLEWLDRTLDRLRSQYRLCFVYMHVPPRDPRPDSWHSLEPADAEKLMDVLSRHDVTAVFAGHLHYYAEDEIKGIPIYITGGAGEHKETGEPHHYLLCTVRADGSYDVVRRDLPHMSDDDYLEYVLRAEFPHSIVLLASCGLILVGLILTLRSAGGSSGRD